MGSLKFKFHPLFFIFGIYYALTGRILTFAIFTATALIHELGHSFVAENIGYKLNKITLMPFGAVVSGDDTEMRAKDEIKIALAGPFINLALGVFVVAVWWIYPESYAFTDIVASANFSMAAVNLIPAMPLDGGRVCCAVLTLFFGRKKAKKISKILGLILGIILLAFFVITLFKTPNLSLLLFSLFILSGLVVKDTDYIRSYKGLSPNALKRGVAVKKQALDKSATVKKLISILDSEAVNEILVFDGDKPSFLLSQEKIDKIVMKGELYSPISAYITV